MIKKIMKNVIWTFLCVIMLSVFVEADTEVHFLDVGQGLSVLMKSNDQYMIYDGGGRESSSFVVSYLKNHGVDELKYMIASHYDEDHLAGLIGCLNVFQTDVLIGPDYTTDTEIYNSFVETVQGIEDLSVHHLEMGETYDLGSASFTVYPSESDGDNGNSITILLRDGNCSFILTGDLDASGELKLLEKGVDVKADVLCVGHHGSSSCTDETFLNAVDPQYAVISCGAGNTYGHPNEETLDKLNQRLIQILRTDLQGTLVAYTDGDSISWSNGSVEEEENSSAEEGSEEPDYVLNTNTMKFHYPNCKSVSQMKEGNRQDYYGTREELINQGYDPCGNCKP